MSSRQTYRYLSDRFAQAGLRPLTRFGQNFLIDLNLVDLIAREAALTDRDVVLEIGTGTGSLTNRLAQEAGWVVTVEVDDGLYQLSGEELRERVNVTRLHQDALRNKNTLAASVLDAVADARARLNDAPFKLVANLPYNVATPIMSNLLMLARPPNMMVATIQKELADRIAAKPATKDYSALSIFIQTVAHVEIVRVLSPKVFWPQPKVTSAVIRITYDPSLAARVDDLHFYHETVRALFFHRRKFLRAVVVSAMGDRMTKEEVDRVLEGLAFQPNDRAEELPVQRVIELVNALGRFLRENARLDEA